MKTLDNPKEILPLLRDIRKKMQELAGEPNSYSQNLGGWCILTSYVLFHILKRRGYKPEVCRNNAHAFIMLDGWYIDVTATQFNSPWNRNAGIVYPPVYCKRTPAKNNVHAIVAKTSQGREIWSKLCKDWFQPIPLTNPIIQTLVKKY